MRANLLGWAVWLGIGLYGGLVYKGNLVRVRVNDAVTEGNVNNAELTYC